MRQHPISRFTLTFLLLVFFVFPGVVKALDLTLEPRFQAGVIDYEFEVKPMSGINQFGDRFADSGFKLASVMPFVSGGATLFADRLFFDFYLQKVFSGSDGSTYNFADETDFSSTTLIDSEFDREEYSVSVGYALGSQAALFVGYRTSKTHFTDTFTTDSSDGPGFDSEKELGKRNVDFKQDGYFFGGAYAFGISEHSVVTLNAALAVLDGKYDTRGSIVDEEDALEDDFPDSSEIGFFSDGDTVGLNLGVTWKGQIDNNFSYTLGLSGYSYDFDADIKASENPAPDLAESVLRYSAGLSYRF